MSPLEHLDVSPEVRSALGNNQPVVALESTIISHGMPYPKNVETAIAVENVVRQNGAVPATIAILGGRLKAGLTESEIEHLGKSGQSMTKCSRRDLPVIVAQKKGGATTVAATMIIASAAGIEVFATGGIGGVHRGVESTWDISADLDELAHTNVTVVCSGVKSILDVPKTLEYLETRGVPVIGFESDTLPAFYTRESDHAVDYRLDSPADVAATIATMRELGLDGGLLIGVPVPERYAMKKDDIDVVIHDAIEDMNAARITGKNTTPFLLSRIAEKTAGASLETNIQLVMNNARVASLIASSLADSRRRQ